MAAQQLQPLGAGHHLEIALESQVQSDDASQNIGSLWIVEANSRSEPQAFVDGEAFYRAGVFESVSVRRVRKGHFHPELADSK